MANVAAVKASKAQNNKDIAMGGSSGWLGAHLPEAAHHEAQLLLPLGKLAYKFIVLRCQLTWDMHRSRLAMGGPRSRKLA